MLQFSTAAAACDSTENIKRRIISPRELRNQRQWKREKDEVKRTKIVFLFIYNLDLKKIKNKTAGY